MTSNVHDSFGSEGVSHTSSSDGRGPFQRDSIITCLERLAQMSGDKMPDHDEIHLPYFRKRDVYKYFVDEFKVLNGNNVKYPCRSYFYRAWKQYCNTIKVRKLGRFAKCTTCVQLRKLIHDAAARRDFKCVEEYKRQKSDHNEQIARERREYKKKGQGMTATRSVSLNNSGWGRSVCLRPPTFHGKNQR